MVSTSKQALRTQLKQQRAALSPQERAQNDAEIAATLFTSTPWQQARAVLPYLSFGPEVDTRAIIERAWDEGKLIALPRVVNGTRDMHWYEVSSFDGLETSKLGVDEPREDTAAEVRPAELCRLLGDQHVLVLVPGLAFDSHGFRMGYGGGFYDTLLETFSGQTIGLCRDSFFIDELACCEPHDKSVQAVCTQRALHPAQ